MNQPETALLLLGSPRLKTKSTSESLGSYLLQRLEGQGIRVALQHVQRSLRAPDGLRELLEAVRANDLVVASFPLYVDCLPAPLIRVLEAIGEDARARPYTRTKWFLALVNCGFPESVHTRTAIAICRCFSAETGFEWLGGLGLGGGEALAGRPLTQAGFLTRNVRKSLDLAADAVARGREVPERAKELMERPLVRPWIYRWIGDFGWRREARKRGTFDNLNDRPFGRK